MHSLDKYGKTPLHLACQRGNVDVVAQILAHKQTKPWMIHKSGAGTAMQLAARYGHTQVIEMLVAAQFEVNEQNTLGETALHHVRA